MFKGIAFLVVVLGEKGFLAGVTGSVGVSGDVGLSKDVRCFLGSKRVFDAVCREYSREKSL